MQLRLARMQVHNFACFQDVDLTPGTLTLVLGRNGVGKSTLLDLLFDLGGVVNANAATGGLLKPFQPKEDGPAVITLTLASGRNTVIYGLTIAMTDQAADEGPGSVGPYWTIAREELWLNGEMQLEVRAGQVTTGELKAALPIRADLSALATLVFPTGSTVQDFKRWFAGVWLLRLEPRRMAGFAEEGDDRLMASGENFVAWLLKRRRRKGLLERLTESTRDQIPELAALQFEKAGRSHVLVAHFADQAVVDFDDLSDGQRCIIVLHAVLNQRPPEDTLLLLDEPDSHVTPEEIRPLVDQIRQRAEQRGGQVIVTSHHPHVIDLLAPDTPWELVRDGDGVVAKPFRIDRQQGITASRFLLLRGSAERTEPQ